MVAIKRQSLITNVPPSYVAQYVRDSQVWLESKRKDDNIENGLWRIHDTLYDLTDFIKKHPGGSSWIEVTKGQDITEAFIVHHLSMEKVEQLLKKYRVKETNQPRNVKLTFNDDGFYMTLRRKVVEKLPEIKKSTKIWSDFYVDGLFIVTLLLAILSQRFQSKLIALLCGLFFTWTGVCGHNYFHQRDNYRMYYFNLIFLGYRDWRITHALAHHMFPNSLLDFELTILEPFLIWEPNKLAKNWFQQYCSFIYWPIVYSIIYLLVFVQNIIFSIFRGKKIYVDEFMPFIIPIIMYLFGGNHCIVDAFKLFSLIVLSGSFVFGMIGAHVGHHHPEIIHEGDAIRKSFDWGLYSVDTVVDRQDMRAKPFFTMSNFGDHALHHLFPSLDHGLLPELYDTFFETLLEFEAECLCYSWFNIFKGNLEQFRRVDTVELDSHQKYLLKHKKLTNGFKEE